jgi:chromosome segregation ATPase
MKVAIVNLNKFCPIGKSKLFTKTSLTEIQDKMRNACIKSYNKFYEVDTRLKEKQKGRNQDINVKDMSNYKKIKKQLDKNAEKLAEANNQTEKLYNSSKDIKSILDKLKPYKLNKNNNVISNEDVEKIKNFTKDVKDITKTVRSVNDLNMAIKDFEHSSFEIAQENSSLKYQLELKTDEIDGLKKDLSAKEKIISKLQAEKEKIKQELQKFKDYQLGRNSYSQS